MWSENLRSASIVRTSILDNRYSIRNIWYLIICVILDWFIKRSFFKAVLSALSIVLIWFQFQTEGLCIYYGFDMAVIGKTGQVIKRKKRPKNKAWNIPLWNSLNVFCIWPNIFSHFHSVVFLQFDCNVSHS